MRLIDADALETHEIYEGEWVGEGEWFRVVYADDIDNAPTIEAEPRWIPVTERLPEKAYGCLVTVWDNNAMGDTFENLLPYFVGWDGDRWNDAEGEECPFEVIAWMKLPTAYKETLDEGGE